MRNLFWYIFLPTYGYQVQVPQVPQSSHGYPINSQPNNQQNSFYVPQQGSSGYMPVAPPRPPPPRGPPQRRRPQQQKQGHDDDHDHNSDYRWEISGENYRIFSQNESFD